MKKENWAMEKDMAAGIPVSFKSPVLCLHKKMNRRGKNHLINSFKKEERRCE
jgi:hypothetical protein